MKIRRILNNNAVICLNDVGEEVIAKGKGIAYGLANGDELNTRNVEKIFVLQNKEARNRYQQLLNQTPIDCIEACEEMIDLIKSRIDKEISDQIYITLTDHISNLIERIRMGITFDHGLLWDVKRLYKEEYVVALEVVEIIKKKFNVKIDEEEAGFISLHIVNAEMNMNLEDVIETTTMIEDIYDIVESSFDIDTSYESLEYTRFIMHLRVFFTRVLTHQNITTERSEVLLDTLKNEYPKQYECVLNILEYVSMRYDRVMDGEILYLLVHIVKLTD